MRKFALQYNIINVWKVYWLKLHWYSVVLVYHDLNYNVTKILYYTNIFSYSIKYLMTCLSMFNGL
jgi:hypothetical protein